ncbi:LacI family DNA-binding transcriptional regulator [Paenibacillus sp. LMG 31456]|uniref:LacI family DNA-binding transcriptional regulator n=1 Tax=Paenibacillus foliorum TaxID=2654974 RepID=A0A972GTI9_9BACL|nr:LacI family DNA-binding transcriptional regulator [Paenibacillus foliorum]NOU96596.1 LacI family DNA-binding transcriptional regulator [Paenibacillus foliorum]
MTTIDDVAKLAGVSKSSVSRVINGNFQYMSEEMRGKIEQAIKDLDYRPNSVAQSLKKKETKVIGLVVGDLNSFWSVALRGVQEECMRNGYGLMVSESAWDPERDLANIHMMKSKRVDGLIVSPIRQHKQVDDLLNSLDIPYIFADSTWEEIVTDQVVTNTIAGAVEAVEHLIQLGHSRIATILFTLENSVRKERLEGYKRALQKHGLPLDETIIKICKAGKGTGVEAVIELLHMPDRPTAIFSTNMHLTLDVLKGVRMAGLDVPGDISVVGYDDSEWAPLLDPPLTTVAVPAFQMGVKAASLLIQKLQNKKPRKPKKIEIMPKLMIRHSATQLNQSRKADELPVVKLSDHTLTKEKSNENHQTGANSRKA